MFTPFLVVLKESSKEQQFGAPLTKTPELHRTHMFATHFCRFARRWEVRAISALHLLHRSACDGHDGGEAVTRTQGSTSACLSFSHFFLWIERDTKWKSPFARVFTHFSKLFSWPRFYDALSPVFFTHCSSDTSSLVIPVAEFNGQNGLHGALRVTAARALKLCPSPYSLRRHVSDPGTEMPDGGPAAALGEL